MKGVARCFSIVVLRFLRLLIRRNRYDFDLSVLVSVCAMQDDGHHLRVHHAGLTRGWPHAVRTSWALTHSALRLPMLGTFSICGSCAPDVVPSCRCNQLFWMSSAKWEAFALRAASTRGVRLRWVAAHFFDTAYVGFGVGCACDLRTEATSGCVTIVWLPRFMSLTHGWSQC